MDKGEEEWRKRELERIQDKKGEQEKRRERKERKERQDGAN